MMMTPSPVSMCGVKIGLCLPRMIFATSDARRPSTMSSASTTYQRFVMSRGVAENVFIRFNQNRDGPAPHRCGLQPGSRQPEGVFEQTRNLPTDMKLVNAHDGES